MLQVLTSPRRRARGTLHFCRSLSSRQMADGRSPAGLVQIGIDHNRILQNGTVSQYGIAVE